MSRACLSRLGWLVAGILGLTACGGGSGDDEGGTSGGSGTVREPWTEYCTGTFTRDAAVLDSFGDPLFTARAGEEYLLAAYDDSFGPQAEFVYLAAAGPDAFEVQPNDTGALPFTSNCAINQGVSYYAVFADVTLYAEETLTTEICSLSEGTVVPAAGGARGYTLVGPLAISGPATYEIFLDGLSAQCGGHTSGFLSVPQTESFGTRTWLVPITSIIGPS